MYVIDPLGEFLRELTQRGEWGDRMHLFEKTIHEIQKSTPIILDVLFKN